MFSRRGLFKYLPAFLVPATISASTPETQPVNIPDENFGGKPLTFEKLYEIAHKSNLDDLKNLINTLGEDIGYIEFKGTANYENLMTIPKWAFDSACSYSAMMGAQGEREKTYALSTDPPDENGNPYQRRKYQQQMYFDKYRLK